MKLTADNYHSSESNMAFWSVSQFKEIQAVQLHDTTMHSTLGRRHLCLVLISHSKSV